jgi:hypothetical protein
VRRAAVKRMVGPHICASTLAAAIINSMDLCAGCRRSKRLFPEELTQPTSVWWQW